MSESVYIDSSNINGTLSNGSITLQQPIHGSFIIDEFVFFNGIYNVNYNNNTIVLNYNGSESTFTLEPGYYNGSQLATELASKCQNNSSGLFSGSFNSKTGKITLTETGGVNFYVTFSSLYNARLFGFDTLSSINASSFTSPYVCDLCPIKHIFIKFNDYDNHIVGSHNYFTATIAINDINTSFGNLLHYQSESEKISYKLNFEKITKTISFKIIDENENEIQFNNCHWKMILKKIIQL